MEKIFKIKNIIYVKKNDEKKIIYIDEKIEGYFVNYEPDEEWNQITGLKDHICLVHEKSFTFFVNDDGEFGAGKVKNFSSEKKIIKAFSTEHENNLFILEEDLKLVFYRFDSNDLCSIFQFENVFEVYLGNKYHVVCHGFGKYTIFNINDEDETTHSPISLGLLTTFIVSKDNQLFVVSDYSKIEIYDIELKDDEIYIHLSKTINLIPECVPSVMDHNSRCIYYLSKNGIMGVLFYENLEKIFYYQMNDESQEQLLITEKKMFRFKNGEKLKMGELFEMND